MSAPADDSEKSPCARPGCYELFVPVPRCPHQRFCGCLCRNALRRVIQCERRWGRRRKRGPSSCRRISAVPQESTSPHIVGPCQADLSWFQRLAEKCSDFIKRNDLRGAAGNRARAMKDWMEGEIRWITLGDRRRVTGDTGCRTPRPRRPWRARSWLWPTFAVGGLPAGGAARGVGRLQAASCGQPVASCRDVASGKACRGGPNRRPRRSFWD